MGSTSSIIGRFLPALLFLLMVSFYPVFSKAQAPVIKTKDTQIDKIEEDLSRERENYLKFNKKEEDLLGRLSALEKKISEQNSLIKKLRDKIRSSKKELSRQQARQNQLAHSLEEVRYRLAQRLIAFYKYAKRGYLQLLGSSQGFDQLRKRVKYLQVITDSDRQMFQEMADIQAQNSKEISLIKEKLLSISELENAEKERLQTIKEEMDKKVVLLMKIHNEKEFYETAVKELQYATENLKDTLVNIEKEKPAQPQKLPSGFNKSKGKLPVPVKGKISRNGGALRDVIPKGQKGIYISGSSGSNVKAVYPGRVDFSGWLKGYGQIIILNHGSRYFTVSAHLKERYKVDGETVKKGEVIGLLGQTGSFTGPKLYFEIRKGSLNLDPKKWLKVR